MLVSKTPLRVSFLGGGTDFPWFFEEHGGAVVSAAINQHIFISAIDSFDGKTTYLKYSKYEEVLDPKQIQHPIFREVISGSRNPAQDISVMAEIPAGNGLASSSAFTIGLINLLARRAGKKLTPEQLASMAINLELDQLGEPIGVQDQLGSAFAGVNFHRFDKGRRFKTVPLVDNIKDFPFEMVLIKVGKQSRSASKFTELQRTFVESDKGALARLIELRDLSLEAGKTLAHDISRLPDFVREGWNLKRASNPSSINEEIEALGGKVEKLGAAAWKLVGAGGGGFVLAICKQGERNNLTSKMRSEGARLIDVEIDFKGANVIEV